jgi:hypothetical protein
VIELDHGDEDAGWLEGANAAEVGLVERPSMAAVDEDGHRDWPTAHGKNRTRVSAGAGRSRRSSRAGSTSRVRALG